MDEGTDHNYEFAKVLGFSKEYRALADSLKTPTLASAVKAFESNMERIIALPVFFAESLVWNTIGNRALGWIPLATGVPGEDAIKAGDGEYYATFDRHVKQAERTFLEGPNAAHAEKYFWFLGTNIIEAFTSGKESQKSGIGEGMESLLFSMVMNSYAAFEALAGDLWIAAVNTYPEAYTGKEGADDKLFTLGDLKRFNYNVSGQIGEFAKASGRVSFQSRKGMEDAYKELFGSTDPYHALKRNADLTKAEKIRHLIAHQAGRVDKKFQDELAGTEYAEVPVGEHLPLNGPLVAALIDACVKTSEKLVRSVDAWAVTYGRRPKR